MSAELADDELLIQRTFDAPAKLVFSMWSNPAHMKRWMGPQEFDCPEMAIDFRVGGAYREIVSNERLVFTFRWDGGPSGELETLVTITFAERDGKTVQTFHQTPFLNVERRDSHVGGWNSSFDKLEVAARAAKTQGEPA